MLTFDGPDIFFNNNCLVAFFHSNTRSKSSMRIYTHISYTLQTTTWLHTFEQCTIPKILLWTERKQRIGKSTRWPPKIQNYWSSISYSLLMMTMATNNSWRCAVRKVCFQNVLSIAVPYCVNFSTHSFAKTIIVSLLLKVIWIRGRPLIWIFNIEYRNH